MKRRTLLTVIPGALAATAVPGIAATLPKSESRSVILDLYAKWCAAEAEYEREGDLRGTGDETRKERAAERRAEKLRVQLVHCQPSTMPEIAALVHILWSSLNYTPGDADSGCDFGAATLTAAIWRGVSGKDGVPSFHTSAS